MSTYYILDSVRTEDKTDPMTFSETSQQIVKTFEFYI